MLLIQRIRATADGSERKYLMRDLTIIEKSKGCPYIVTFYGVLLKEVSLRHKSDWPCKSQPCECEFTVVNIFSSEYGIPFQKKAH